MSLDLDIFSSGPLRGATFFNTFALPYNTLLHPTKTRYNCIGFQEPPLPFHDGNRHVPYPTYL